jgi:hypothetical protein
MSEQMLPLNVDVAPDETEKNSPVQTAETLPLIKQGKYRWCFEYRNRNYIDKYNSDSVKNVYAVRDEVQVPVTGVAKIALYNEYNRRITDLEVPVGAIAFQRRRVGPINYSNRFFTFTDNIPAYKDPKTNKIYPPKTITKNVPYEDYSECWIIGWRTKDAVEFKVVYPQTGENPFRIDEHTEWCKDGSKDWLREPQWLKQEQV